MLLYGTGICHYALYDIFLIFYSFCPFLLNKVILSGIDKSLKSTIPACPSLMCFLTRVTSEKLFI